MIKGYTYINLYLFPVYVNDSYKTSSDIIVVQRYNSSKWMSYANNTDLDNLHTLVTFSDEEEVLSKNYYSNYNLITDLFDIILTKHSEFRSNKINESVDYMLRQKERGVDLYTNENRYLANFLESNQQKNTIILLANPRSRNCQTLIKKRQRLNEYL